ncbi:helix-turn-helix domain-containing protein [Marinomonas algicola]|uniref:helix-turn-helix domain-containing protein n=1 Tax=Marinomonas algicola TaxID=2773454 RepID=UPI00174A77E8|nr:AraC family transcriptional regulator [Marinomonas algicola]
MLLLFVFGLIKGIVTLVFFQESEEELSLMGFMDYFYMTIIFYVGVMGLMQPRIYNRSERFYITELKNNFGNKKENAIDNPIESDNKNRSEIRNCDFIKKEENTELTQSEHSNKYLKSALSEADMLRISKKLEALMDKETAYLEPNLSMPQLAEKLSLSPNYLSQTINTIYEITFFDYINKKRIDYAKQLLVNPTLADKSIVDIAVDAAFNSRSAFYSAFKKHVGMTPVQFRKSSKSSLS